MSTNNSANKSTPIWRIANLKLVFLFLCGGAILISIAHILHGLEGGNATLWQITILSLGTGSFMAGFFNIVYAVKTREAFVKILSDVVPTIAAGIIVHQSHDDGRLLRREAAISQYVGNGDRVRLCTATGDNYFKFGEAPNNRLREKIERGGCEVHALLYLPVFEHFEDTQIGQRTKSPQDLMNEHKSLMADYEDMIKLGNGRVVIRFFTVPLHTNIVMYGDNRSFSAPIMHFCRGRQNLPCYEMYPSGPDSVFFKFQRDFDQLFDVNDKRKVLELTEVKSLYEEAQYNYERLCQLFRERPIQATQ